MNIWLSFVPGGGASMLEALLRSCTSINGLPVNKDFLRDNTAHGMLKQWHPQTKETLFAYDYEPAEDNVFTPIVPMSDLIGVEVIDFIDNQDGIKVYIGPSTDIVSEFALVCMQKVPNYINYIMPIQNAGKWSDTELEPWEKREYLSLYLMQWWVPQMREQWIHAKQLGFHCADTMDLFKNVKEVFRVICNHAGVNITNKTDLEHYCNTWMNSQNKIWQDWENLVQYKQGSPAIISGDIIQEAIIQYHLREQGIELKCYGLNTFPNSEELKQYYE